MTASDIREQVLTLLRDRGPLAFCEIDVYLNHKRWRRVDYALRVLRQRGQIVSEDGKWRVKECE